MRNPTRTATKVRVVRIVVASPGDVQAERDSVAAIADELNQHVAPDRNMVLRVIRWETDATPGFHPDGPQALIDSVLKIDDCDLLVGIFWKRFGTPVKKAASGTEHEIRQAYESWKKHGSPQIFVYFNSKPFNPVSKADKDQWERVQKFKQSFPVEGLWWKYKGAKELTALLRAHLTRWILDATPSRTTAPRKNRKASLTNASLVKAKGAPKSRTGAAGIPDMFPSFQTLKIKTLRARLAALHKDYALASSQLMASGDDVERARLQRKIEAIADETELLETELDGKLGI